MKINSRWVKMMCGSIYACVCVCVCVAISFVEGCEGPVDLLCHKNDDCIDGYLCNVAGKCLAGTHMQWVTPEQIDKVATADDKNGESYQYQLVVEGGLPPLTWTLSINDDSTTNLDWLDLDPTSGLLRNRQGVFPKESQITKQAHFTVTVTDISNRGKTDTISRVFTIVIAGCVGDVVDCYTGTVDKCLLGKQPCNDGVRGVCTPSTIGTNSTDKCGPNCEPCFSIYADTCSDGVCKCGVEDNCSSTPNTTCCKTNGVSGCVDTTSNASNCGKCGNICTGTLPGCCNGMCVDFSSAGYCGSCDKHCTTTNVFNVPENQIVCQNPSNSTCGYTGNCSPNYLDCNDTTPGCETPLDKSNCGACGIVCNTYGANLGPTCENGACKCLNDDDCSDSSKCLVGECRCRATLLPCPTNVDQYKYCDWGQGTYYCCPTKIYQQDKCVDSCIANGNQWCPTNNKCCKTCPDIGCL